MSLSFCDFQNHRVAHTTKKKDKLSKPQPQHNTTVGFDLKMTLETNPPHTNFSGTSKQVRDLKFGTDTNLIKIT